MIVELANPRIVDIVVANQQLLLGLADRCRFEQWQAEARALARLWDQDGGYDPNDDPTTNRLSYGTTIDGLTTLAATLTGDNAEVVTQAIETEADALFRRAVADHKQMPRPRGAVAVHAASVGADRADRPGPRRRRRFDQGSEDRRDLGGRRGGADGGVEP